jgi:hypothetical protein
MKEKRWTLGAAAFLLPLMLTAPSAPAQQSVAECQEEVYREYAANMQDNFDWLTECRGSVLDDTSCDYFEPFGCDWCTEDFNEDSDEDFTNFILDMELCETLGSA